MMESNGHTQAWKQAQKYRKFNAQTVVPQYPMPRIDDLLEEVKNNKLMLTLHLMSGYHHIPINEADNRNADILKYLPVVTHLIVCHPLSLWAPARFSTL